MEYKKSELANEQVLNYWLFFLAHDSCLHVFKTEGTKCCDIALSFSFQKALKNETRWLGSTFSLDTRTHTHTHSSQISRQ
jgi:uncharacterized protein YcgI (DUF1989 family)